MIHAQPLPASLHSALSLFSMVLQDGLPDHDHDHQAAESFREYEVISAGRMAPGLVRCRSSEAAPAECALPGRQLSRPRRWGINE